MKSLFVSSTFADMQFERDYLQRRVLPPLHEKCIAHGDDVQFIDLRLGIDTFHTDGNSMRKVLQVCIEKLDAGDGLIIFLGDRYGTVIGNEDMSIFTEELRRQFTSVDNQSVTALEIDHALFHSETPKPCIICLRTLNKDEFPSEELRNKFVDKESADIKRLSELKTRLREQFRDRIIDYTAKWDGDKLIEFRTLNGGGGVDKDEPLSDALIRLIETDWRDKWENFHRLSWQEQERYASRQLIEQRAAMYVERGEGVDWLKQLFASERIIFLSGASGAGKSTLLCKLIATLEVEVCCIFAGLSHRSSNAYFVLRQLIYFVEQQLGEPHLAFDEAQEPYREYQLRLNELCRKSERPFYIVLDGVEQLLADEHRDLLDFLPSTANIHCLVSAADFNFSKAQIFNGVNKVHMLNFLEPNEIIEVFHGILERNHKQPLPEWDDAVKKKSGASSPLWLAIAAQALSMLSADNFNAFGNPADVIPLTVKFIEDLPDEPPAAAVHILKRAAQFIDADRNILRAVELLAISSSGLRRFDIQQIFAAEGTVFVQSDFELLTGYMSNIFVERNGFIDLQHIMIREGILSELTPEQRLVDEQKLAAHVISLPTKDMLRTLEGARCARILNDRQFFARLLGEAAETQNSVLIHSLKRQMMSKDNKFFFDVLHQINELPEDILKGFGDFFARIFPSMLNGSAEEYQLSQSIVSELPVQTDKLEYFADDTFYYSKEMFLARNKAFLGDMDGVVEHTTKVIRWGEKIFQCTSDADRELHRLMCSAYSLLTQTLLIRDDYSAAERSASRFLSWAQRARKLEGHDWTDDFNEANALAQLSMCCVINDSISLEQGLHRQREAHKMYESVLSESNFNPEVLRSLAYNLLNLTRLLPESDRAEAIKLKREAEDHTEQLLAIGAGDVENLSVAGGIYHLLALMEIELREFESALRHGKRSISLYCNAARLNPSMYMDEAISTVTESLCGEFRRVGRDELAVLLEDITPDDFL